MTSTADQPAIDPVKVGTLVEEFLTEVIDAYREYRRGGGAEPAMQLIEQALDSRGLLPTEAEMDSDQINDEIREQINEEG